MSNRKTQIAFASAMALLLIAAGLSYQSSVAALESDRLVRHTHEVIETLQDLTLDVRAIESSARSFGLTGDSSYLGDLGSSIQRVTQDQEAFGTLTIDNPEQQRRLPELARLATAKIQLAESIISRRRDQGLNAAVDVLQGGGDQRLMSDLLALLDGSKREELRLLRIRDADSHMSQRQAKFGLIFATVMALAIAATAGWSVRWENWRRRQTEEALFAEKERAQVTLNSIGDAVASTDIEGNLTFLNHAAEELSGWSSQEALGRPMPEVFRIVDEASRETIPNPIEIAVAGNRSGHLPPNSVLIRRDGFEIPVDDSVAPIHDQDGRATGAVIAFRDATVARKLAEHMAYAAQHDFLTGLPNRMLFNDRVGQAIVLAKRYNKLVAVLYLDLDGFKQINDSWGHAVGDKLLRTVAGRLVDCARGSDTVSRQGGDEFVVLLSEVENSDEVAIIATRMLAAVSESRFIDQNELHVTTSIGVAVHPDDGIDAATLIENADTAMYQAKTSGSPSYRFFRPVVMSLEQNSA